MSECTNPVLDRRDDRRRNLLCLDSQAMNEQRTSEQRLPLAPEPVPFEHQTCKHGVAWQCDCEKCFDYWFRQCESSST